MLGLWWLGSWGPGVSRGTVREYAHSVLRMNALEAFLEQKPTLLATYA